MAFRQKLGYISIGCVCTMAGVLLASTVLPLFATSGESEIFDTIYAKTFVVMGKDDTPVATWGGVLEGFVEEEGSLMIFGKDGMDSTSLMLSPSQLFLFKGDRKLVSLSDHSGNGLLSLRGNGEKDGVFIGNPNGHYAMGFSDNSPIEVKCLLGIDDESKNGFILLSDHLMPIFGRGGRGSLGE